MRERRRERMIGEANEWGNPSERRFMRRHSVNLVGSAREGNAGAVSGHGCDPWREGLGMKQRRLGLLFLSLLVFLFADVTTGTATSFAGEEKPGLGSPCGSSAEAWPEGHLKQGVGSEGSGDGAKDFATGPCIRQTEKPASCPVKCFRADPVCGTDKITYWCGVADAKCAGVGVAHDGYCNLWELDTNVGSTTALRAAQSLQLVHILWLAVAGLLIVLGSV